MSLGASQGGVFLDHAVDLPFAHGLSGGNQRSRPCHFKHFKPSRKTFIAWVGWLSQVLQGRMPVYVNAYLLINT